MLIIDFPGGLNTQFKMFRYPGGEVQVRLTDTSVCALQQNTDKIHVVARITDGEIVALAQLLDAIKTVTSVDVQLILPYLPYSRADRRFVEGDSHGLGVFGRLLGMISYEIVTLDVHSEQAKKYTRHLTNISPLPFIHSAIDILDGTASYGTSIISTAVLLPDDGSYTRYGLSNNPYVLHASKKRDPETGKLSGFEVPPPDKFQADNILIVDDICDGGGTFNGIAEALDRSGNTLPRYLYVTHGIFSKGFTDLFKNFNGIFTTDSYGTKIHPAPEDIHRFHQFPCIPVILDKLKEQK